MRASLLVLVFLAACGSDLIPLGRQFHDHWVTTCAGGVNQNAELADRDECSDALNVWAPNGRVETRPGYVGLGASAYWSAATGASDAVLISEDGGVFTASTGTLTLSNLGVGNRWYAGTSSIANIAVGFQIRAVTGDNSNAVYAKPEYYNGTEWKYLHVNEIDVVDNNELRQQPKHLNIGGLPGGYIFQFVPPADWATTTVTAGGTDYTRYFIRFTLRNNGDSTLDASVAMSCSSGGPDMNIFATTNNDRTVGLFAAQFPSNKRYISAALAAGGTYNVANSKEPHVRDSIVHSPATLTSNEPASFAVVPQFSEAFMAYDHYVTRHVAHPTSSDSVTATVETADYAVGEAGGDGGQPAPYAPSQIVSLSEFPRAKYIQFFKGQLWVANLLDEPFTVRWGAPTPYHKVWPALQYEVLAEHDNSPITGMHPLGEFMVIFKQDSIWMAYDAGIDSFGLQQYAIRQVVAGTGCVSNASIKAIRGNLIFLAEDGLYSFNGQDVHKVSLSQTTGADRLAELWPSINPGRRPFAAAAHWRTKHAYLLSMSTSGSTENSTTLVWDYDRDSFWLWDNIDAQHWLEDEGSYDEETLYFGDSSGRIYRMGGLTDHGAAISSYVTTQRLGWRNGDGAKRRARSLEVAATNDTVELSCELLANDEGSGTSGTVPLTDDTEADWDDFSYNDGSSTDDNWVALRRRLRRIDFRKDFDWLQVKVSHAEKNQRMQLAYLDVGMLPIGRQR